MGTASGPTTKQSRMLSPKSNRWIYPDASATSNTASAAPHHLRNRTYYDNPSTPMIFRQCPVKHVNRAIRENAERAPTTAKNSSIPISVSCEAGPPRRTSDGDSHLTIAVRLSNHRFRQDQWKWRGRNVFGASITGYVRGKHPRHAAVAS